MNDEGDESLVDSMLCDSRSRLSPSGFTRSKSKDFSWFEYCIYRVPKKLRHVNDEAYTPTLVSIGPFHHELQESRGVKMQRQIYLDKFFMRTGKKKEDLASIIESNKEKISNSYSETFQLTDQDFVKKILFDAIFIIELFLRNFQRQEYEGKDYILSNPWLESHIKQDLILLENQLPFKYLQKFYKYAFDGEIVIPFLELALGFFFSDKHRIPTDFRSVKHFTDLHRMFYCPTYHPAPKKLTEHRRYTATKLDEAGLQFKALVPVDIDFPKRSLLDIGFHKHKCLDRFPCFNLSWLFSCLPCLKFFSFFKNVQCFLKVPQLVIDEHTECFFRNLMALEQYYYPCNAYICSYVVLVGDLIKTEEDVALLVDKEVIINQLGSNAAVVALIKNLSNNIVLPISYYSDLAIVLNEYRDHPWNRFLVAVKSTYFSDFGRVNATVATLLALAGLFLPIFTNNGCKCD